MCTNLAVQQPPPCENIRLSMGKHRAPTSHLHFRRPESLHEKLHRRNLLQHARNQEHHRQYTINTTPGGSHTNWRQEAGPYFSWALSLHGITSASLETVCNALSYPPPESTQVIETLSTTNFGTLQDKRMWYATVQDAICDRYWLRLLDSVRRCD